ncbi:CHAD domain-containing protein [Streptomyces sp. NPDC089919]|uniref:CHAD domain-containing protein n=1 Tax=Streptomyces sp. NPDC089919 TaxID=3155188 RepID=UPI0034228CAB
MAQQHHDSSAGDVLGAYLRSQATAFLRGLRLHEESGADAAEGVEAARVLRGAARRISGSLATYRPVADTGWADGLRTELTWLSTTLADEHAYAARLTRLLDALHRLSGTGGPEVPAPRGTARGALTVGSARAAALLERQLTLARTRAHSATLHALGSSRFHAVADAVAVLASEVPLDPVAAVGRTDQVLVPLSAQVADRLAVAVAELPLVRAGHPYNAEALVDDEGQDAPWHRVRTLLRIHRYAQEALTEDTARLTVAGLALDRHRDAAEAAGAAAHAAKTPRIAPATAYALGVLHADQRHEVEAARFEFQRLWRRAEEPDGADGAALVDEAGIRA